ncbi:protein kinase [Humibacillus xanthopallidus]|uniref:protein kinase domain-containing protein n=1 Tax=Humibacillus xanthopallidus TaxID=412689 RepID=UPI00384DF4BE
MSDRLPPRPQVPGHRVESVLGRGASSTVWQGRDAMGAAVAIKVPHEVGWLADEQATRTEQHVLMAVRHEHLVALRDVVAMPDDRVALVFDLVTGSTLRETVHARGHLRSGEVVTVVTPLCEAVAALHGAGGLHGDISPANVMVTAAGRPLLLDLGAARLAGSPADAPVFGTPGFVAPEVRQGFAPTEASDVFSLGALAWFCLTGNGAPDTMFRLDPEVIRSHVGGDFAEVIGACIDPDPSRRPPSAGLARLFYETAPAEAVEVVVGADEASALTHRIRAEAREEGAVPAQQGRTGRERWRGAVGWRLRWRPGWLALWPFGSSASRRRPSLTTAMVAGVAVILAVVIGVGTVVARSAAAPGEPPESAQRSAAVTRAPVTATAAQTPTVADTAVAAGAPPAAGVTPTPTRSTDADALLGRADAPSTSPLQVVQALSDRRAEALVATDPARLARVNEPSSPAWAADVAVIERLRAEGVRWEGLALEVAQAAPVSATTTQSVVRARVDWTAYTVVGRGLRMEQPAATGEVLDFTLQRGAQGWRIVAISAPAT